MTAGFQVFTESGVLSFDGTYQVPSQKGKATATATESPMGEEVTVAKFYTLTVSSDTPPVIALRKMKVATGQQGIALLNVSRSGSNWTFKIVVVDTNEADFSFTYYSFGSPSASSGVGLDVYSESGEVVFSAASPVMRPVSSMSSGNSYAVFSTSKMNYFESVSFDTNLMVDIYTSDYEIQVHAISGTSLISTDVNIYHSQGFQPPNLGYENYGTYQEPILIKTTNQ